MILDRSCDRVREASKVDPGCTFTARAHGLSTLTRLARWRDFLVIELLWKNSSHRARNLSHSAMDGFWRAESGVSET